MDCALPLLSGYEATQKIKSECYKPPLIVALTANSLQENVEKCYSSGMDNFLAKPIQRSDLINIIFQYFDKKTP
jgi:CheY-like chemotaxis protein